MEASPEFSGSVAAGGCGAGMPREAVHGSGSKGRISGWPRRSIPGFTGVIFR